MIVSVDERRIQGDHDGPGDEADGIQKIHHLKSHQPRDDCDDEYSVTELSQGLVIKRFRPLLFPKQDPIEEIDCGPHRAKPPAEKIAEDKNEQEGTEGREHPADDPLLSEEGDDPDKRIEPEIKIDRDLQFERKSGMKNQINEKTKREGLNRSFQVKNRSGHVAVTFFTLTFERSISPNPCS
jgi:hypothetical protein